MPCYRPLLHSLELAGEPSTGVASLGAWGENWEDWGRHWGGHWGGMGDTLGGTLGRKHKRSLMLSRDHLDPPLDSPRLLSNVPIPRSAAQPVVSALLFSPAYPYPPLPPCFFSTCLLPCFLAAPPPCSALASLRGHHAHSLVKQKKPSSFAHHPPSLLSPCSPGVQVQHPSCPDHDTTHPPSNSSRPALPACVRVLSSPHFPLPPERRHPRTRSSTRAPDPTWLSVESTGTDHHHHHHCREQRHHHHHHKPQPHSPT